MERTKSNKLNSKMFLLLILTFLPTLEARTIGSFLSTVSTKTSRHNNSTIFIKTRQTSGSSESIQDITSENGWTSHYQVITICNTLPSILKCQNRQHYLILHRVSYGLSDSAVKDGCVSKSNCMDSETIDEFNCTGSNICVFYPSERDLANCHPIKSNLTQIEIACVNLANLKKYLMKKQDDFHEKNVYSDQATSTIISQLYNFTTNTNTKNNQAKNNQSTFKPFNKVFTFATPVTFLTTNSNSNSLVISISIFCIFLAIVVMSLIYYKIKIKQLLIETSRKPIPKNNSDQKISASFNTNSNCRIYMSSNSASSFKSLPNVSAHSDNLGVKYCQNTKSCSEIDPDNSFKATIKNNYENINKKFNKKLNNIQDFFQEYVYNSKNSTEPICQTNLNISEPRLFTETPGSSRKSKDEDIYAMPEKLKSKKSDYYQINAKILSVLASNHNLLKKSSIKDLNDLIQKSNATIKENQSFVNDEEAKSSEHGSVKKFARESESSSSELSEEDVANEQFNESQEEEDFNDYVPYYQRNYGLSGTYMLYDIPEEDFDEDTQDSLEIEAAQKNK